MKLATTTRKPKKTGKGDLAKILDGQADRLMHLDLCGTAEAAEKILHVERARIGKWRRKGILLSTGERVKFPEPILMVTTSALINECSACRTHFPTDKHVCPKCGSKVFTEVEDHTKLAASPLWWTDDITALAKLLAKNKPRD
jgi:predicted RNA-binding Zn-ribbon protein involved in translation (DUF1610 family)